MRKRALEENVNGAGGDKLRKSVANQSVNNEVVLFFSQGPQHSNIAISYTFIYNHICFYIITPPLP